MLNMMGHTNPYHVYMHPPFILAQEILVCKARCVMVGFCALNCWLGADKVEAKCDTATAAAKALQVEDKLLALVLVAIILVLWTSLIFIAGVFLGRFTVASNVVIVDVARSRFESESNGSSDREDTRNTTRRAARR